MNKIILLLIACVLGYNSVYFKKLSEQNSNQIANFDFSAYADSLYYKGILIQTKPITLAELQKQLADNKETAFVKFGNKLGIGNTAYFMISVEGVVLNKNEAELTVKLPNGQKLNIDSKFIFGNAIRDASKLVALTDFKTNAEFNKVSEALNDVIREKAIPDQLKEIKVGDKVAIEGAIKQSKNETLQINILPCKIVKTN